MGQESSSIFANPLDSVVSASSISKIEGEEVEIATMANRRRGERRPAPRGDEPQHKRARHDLKEPCFGCNTMIIYNPEMRNMADILCSQCLEGLHSDLAESMLGSRGDAERTVRTEVAPAAAFSRVGGAAAGLPKREDSVATQVPQHHIGPVQTSMPQSTKPGKASQPGIGVNSHPTVNRGGSEARPSSSTRADTASTREDTKSTARVQKAVVERRGNRATPWPDRGQEPGDERQTRAQGLRQATRRETIQRAANMTIIDVEGKSVLACSITKSN